MACLLSKLFEFRLLTTAVWIDGRPLEDPMPHFHMTRADAKAVVVAFLRSLR